MKKPISIIKASGETANFSEEKLRTSMLRSGASPGDVDKVIEEINAKLYDGISTKKIYKLAFNLLKESSRHLAARYHLKSAIMELGPSGFPFEKFIGEILNYHGYKTSVDVLVKGKCVQHEIDVLAQRGNDQLMIECKYHNQPGTYSDVKIPLYIQARYTDILSEWTKIDPAKHYEGWVITNTKFSDDAIQYGICAGLKLTGWDYPFKGSLKNQIDELGLYPITCLTSISKGEKELFLANRIVLCKELNETELKNIGIKESRLPVILQEIHQLCKQLTNKENEQH